MHSRRALRFISILVIVSFAFTMLCVLGGCKNTEAGNGGDIKRLPADNIRRPITTSVSWYPNFWMDITVIIDNKDVKGPIEKRDGTYSKTWDMKPGQHIEIIAKHHKDMDPPPGDTTCIVALFGNPIAPNGTNTTQSGECHASATVPAIETQG